MLTNDEIYQTLDYKVWKCAHEIKEELDTSGLISLEAELISTFIENQPDVIIDKIGRYLTTAVDEKVVEARKRAAQSGKQIELCGLQPQELEYRLLPQEVKKNFGSEAGRLGEYGRVA